MGKHYPKMQCSMTIAALSIFEAKTNIALTADVRNDYTNTLNSIFFTGTYMYLFP